MFNGQKLKEIREVHHMTQKKAAALFNISPSTLSHYEKGNRMPSNDFLLKFSKVFNITNEELLSLLFESTLHDPNATYLGHPALEESFVVLDDKKLKELPFPEKMKIRDYAIYIYTQYKNKTNY